MPKGLHHLLVSDHLIDQCGLFPSRLRLKAEHGKGAFCDEPCHEKGKRRDQHHHQRDSHIRGQHEKQGAQDRHDACKQLGKSHQQSIRKLIHIRDHTAGDLSIRMIIHIF